MENGRGITRRGLVGLGALFLFENAFPMKLSANELSPDLSLKEGVELLRDKTKVENLEQGAFFAKLKNGKRMWLPTKITERSITGVNFAIDFDLLFKKYKLREQDIDKLLHIHTHPFLDIETLRREGRKSRPTDAKKYTITLPSGDDIFLQIMKSQDVGLQKQMQKTSTLVVGPNSSFMGEYNFSQNFTNAKNNIAKELKDKIDDLSRQIASLSVLHGGDFTELFKTPRGKSLFDKYKHLCLEVGVSIEHFSDENLYNNF